MPKKLPKMLIVLATLLCVLCALNACAESGATTASLKQEELTLRIGEKARLGAFFDTDKPPKEVFYAVGNGDLIDIDGELITAKAAGKTYVMITVDEIVLRLNVIVIDDRKVSAAAVNVTCVYDGNLHNIAIKGKLPSGTTIKYFLNGKEFTGASEAGVYEITAEITVPEKYELTYAERTAILTINKAFFNMNAVKFNSVNCEYDGKEKTALISGKLPDGVSVSYVNNKATEAGTYKARAIFFHNNPNYEPIPDMNCEINILPMTVYLGDYGFSDRTDVYDTEEHFLRAEKEFPYGITVEYVDENGKETTDGFVDAGKYKVGIIIRVAAAVMNNYVFTSVNSEIEFEKIGENYVSKKATFCVLTINKAEIVKDYELVFTDKNGNKVDTVIYGNNVVIGQKSSDGYSVYLTEKPHGINGEFLDEITVEYSPNLTVNATEGFLDVGLYSIKATFVLPEEAKKNYLDVPSELVSFNVVKATLDLSSVTVKLKGEQEYDIFSGKEFDVEFDPDKRYELFIDSTAVGALTLSKVDVTCKISYNAGDLKEIDGEPIYHAGSYFVMLSFKVKICPSNYNRIDSKSTSFYIKPHRIKIDAVAFSDVHEVYDGTPKSMSFSLTLPQGVESKIKYIHNGSEVEGNSFINAGKYLCVATLYYNLDDENWRENDYLFIVGSKITNKLYANLYIDKAKYDFTNEELTSKYAQSDIPVYDEGMTLEDLDIFYDGNARWKDKQTVITAEETAGSDPTTFRFTATALYNADRANYEDFEFYYKKTASADSRLTVSRKPIDIAEITVNDQFIAYTGTQAEPYVADKRIKATFVKNAVEPGGYRSSCTIYPKEKTYVFVRISGESAEYAGEVFAKDNVSFRIYNGKFYEYEQGTCNLIRYKKEGGENAVILSGTKVVAKGAFDEISLTSLYVPDSVENVAAEVLGKGENLISLDLATLCYPSANGLKRFFKDSLTPRGLKNIVVRNDTTIDADAFVNCVGLESVEYISPITSVGTAAFYGCDSLRTIILREADENVSVGKEVFYGCSSLTELTLPSLLGKTLAYYFGGNDAAIKKIEFTSTVAYELPRAAFKNFISLEEIILSSGLKAVGEGAFEGVTAPIDLTNTSVTAIGDKAFAGYAGKTLTLNENTTAIGAYAFYNTSLTQIALPAALKTLKAKAFAGCSAKIAFHKDGAKDLIKESVFEEYAGSEADLSGMEYIGNNAFKNSKITSLELDCDVGSGAFSGCELLKTAVFGENVTSIGANAFFGCAMLTEATFLGETPPAIGRDAFATGEEVLNVKVAFFPDKYKEALIASGRKTMQISAT